LSEGKGEGFDFFFIVVRWWGQFEVSNAGCGLHSLSLQASTMGESAQAFLSRYPDMDQTGDVCVCVCVHSSCHQLHIKSVVRLLKFSSLKMHSISTSRRQIRGLVDEQEG
jgi:hypothetical protein